MKYRQLPRTDLILPEAGFGVWTVATNWWGEIPEEQKAALLENALELGVTFFDTAHFPNIWTHKRTRKN